MQKIFWIITLLLLVRCAEPPENSVVWFPLEPKEREEILISYYPEAEDASIKHPVEMILVYEVAYQDTEVVSMVGMEKKNRSWQKKINLKDGAYFLGFKFEDRQGSTDDNQGLGWNLVVGDEKGDIPQDAHYLMGLCFDHGPFRPEAEADYEKALANYEKELELHPENQKVLWNKWLLQLQLTGDKEELKDQIKGRIDSLVKIHSDDPEVLRLAYLVYTGIVGDEVKAKKFGKEFINRFPQHRKAPEVAWELLHLEYGSDWNNQIEGSRDFLKKFPKHQEAETACWRLAMIYQSRGDMDEATYFYQKTLEIDPLNVPVRLSLAEIAMEKEGLSQAQKLIQDALEVCAPENYTISNPWYSYAQRKVWVDQHLSDISSLQGNLHFKKGEFHKAINSWDKALSFNPQWPAIIWTNLGRVCQIVEEKKKAEDAYLKALLSDPAQKEAKDSLLSLYRLDNATDSGFTAHLKKQLLKKGKTIAQLAPDFEITDLQGRKFRLSQMKGRVVVLYFWATWCGGCRYILPRINELHQEFKDESEIVFWAISPEGQNTIRNFLKENEFGYHPFYGGRKVRESYGMVPFPTHIVIDPDGYIRYRHIGPLGELKDLLKEEIETLLKEKTILE
jgi:tetratricopeptide (TPR) repeat protein